MGFQEIGYLVVCCRKESSGQFQPIRNNLYVKNTRPLSKVYKIFTNGLVFILIAVHIHVSDYLMLLYFNIRRRLLSISK
jgi:flagellin-specific chaperone FliS